MLVARRHRLAAIAALGVVVAGGRAHAQGAEAEGLFSDGNKLMAQGKLAQACDAFEASNRVEPRAGTLIRLGECREQNHQLASAWSAYKDALTRVKDPRKRKLATTRAAALEPKLSRLTVVVSPDHRVDGLTLTRNGNAIDPMLWNRALPIDGGDYVIAGRAAGHADWQATARVPIEGGKVSIDVPKLKELSKPASPAVPPPQPVAAQPPPGSAPADRDVVRPTGTFTTRRKLAIGVMGASVVAVASGAFLGQAAKGKKDDAFQLCPDPAMCDQPDRANALIASSHSRALQANVAFAISAAAAIGAGVLWFTGAPDAEHPPRVSLVPTLAPGASVVIMGSF